MMESWLILDLIAEQRQASLAKLDASVASEFARDRAGLRGWFAALLVRLGMLLDRGAGERALHAAVANAQPVLASNGEIWV